MAQSNMPVLDYVKYVIALWPLALIKVGTDLMLTRSVWRMLARRVIYLLILLAALGGAWVAVRPVTFTLGADRITLTINGIQQSSVATTSEPDTLPPSQTPTAEITFQSLANRTHLAAPSNLTDPDDRRSLLRFYDPSNAADGLWSDLDLPSARRSHLALGAILGRKNTGGHAIRVERVLRQHSTLLLEARVTTPGRDDWVTMALTYPHEIIAIDWDLLTDIRSVELRDTSGQLLARATLPERPAESSGP